MLPLSDGLSARRFPIVTVGLIVANVAVFVLYELPHVNLAVYHAAFYPCTVDGTCRGPEPWQISWLTAMFTHAGWDHLLGNMLFLAIFGKNVEDAFGRARYLGFYLAGGLAACAAQTTVTLLYGSAAGARVPTVGASGAIAAVLGAFFVLYPHARIKSLIIVFIVRIPAWVYLGMWFLYQLVNAHYAIVTPGGTGGGVAFSAHVGGFVFGVVVTALLVGARRIAPNAPQRPAFGAI
jgi:rhomboid family protein